MNSRFAALALNGLHCRCSSTNCIVGMSGFLKAKILCKLDCCNDLSGSAKGIVSALKAWRNGSNALNLDYMHFRAWSDYRLYDHTSQLKIWQNTLAISTPAYANISSQNRRCTDLCYIIMSKIAILRPAIRFPTSKCWVHLKHMLKILELLALDNYWSRWQSWYVGTRLTRCATRLSRLMIPYHCYVNLSWQDCLKVPHRQAGADKQLISCKPVLAHRVQSLTQTCSHWKNLTVLA